MDINQVRSETPHCQDKLFMDSAGASLMPGIVAQTVVDYLRKEEEYGGYRLAEMSLDDYNELYVEAAEMFNCKPHNIAFANNATDAYARALSSIKFKRDDVIITTDDDYVSSYMNFISLKSLFGIKIVRVNNLENGDLDLEHFEALVDQYSPKLVAITHIPTNSGLIQDVEAIGDICHERNILYLVDACQSAGQLTVDVQKIKCDFLSLTGRKFLRGPRGTGLLYVSGKILDLGLKPLYIDLRGATWTGENQFEVIDSAKRFELWESPCALVIGLKEAIKYANNLGIENIYAYNQEILNAFRNNLGTVSGVQVLDNGSRKSNILTFVKDGRSLEQTKNHLKANDVFFSISRKDNALIDFTKKGHEWAVRLSPHYFNSKQDIDRVTEIIDQL